MPGIRSVDGVEFMLHADEMPYGVGRAIVATGLTTSHAAVKVTYADGRVLYYDNGAFGGIFNRTSIPLYAYFRRPGENTGDARARPFRQSPLGPHTGMPILFPQGF